MALPIVWLTCFGTLLCVGRVSAQDDDVARARAEFNRGVGQYEAGQIAPALEAFQEAYRIRPHPSVRVNIANCYEQLGRPIEAMFHFERYLEETTGAATPARREVQTALTRLRDRVADVTLHVSPDGALVRIGDSETRRAPLVEAIRLPAGSHAVTVSHDGYATDRRMIEVRGGEPLAVTVRLERASVAVAVEPVGPMPPPDSSGMPPDPGMAAPPSFVPENGAPVSEPEPVASMVQPEGRAERAETGIPMSVWISGGVTGALLIGTVITGALALGAESDFDQAVRDSNNNSLSVMQRSTARRDGLDAADSADAFALVSDVLLVGTLIGAGVTVYLLVSGSGEESASEQAEGARWMAAPSISSEGGGIVLRGVFE